MLRITSASQTGILMPGPGGTRINSIQADLVGLTLKEQELVNRAKEYAIEQSIKSIMTNTKQILPTNQQQQQKTIQRHQALVLMCRVYVGSISFELKEESIMAAFSPYGAIKSTNMSWDPVTLKHKGFAFVEYEIPEAAQLALEHMNGIQLGGRQIKVGRPSNMPQAAPIIQQIQEECKEKNRIYISNVHQDLSEAELANIFEPFGKVRSCKLAMTPNVEQPLHRGYGFVEFETEKAATEALTMNSFDLWGQILHACRATTPAENLSIYGTLESSESSQTPPSGANLASEEDIQAQLERTNKEQEKDGNDNVTSEVKTEAQNQQETHKLQVSSSSILTTNLNGVGSKDNENSVSNIIVLRNMVGADDDLDDNLQLDVFEECGKHGPVSQVLIYVDKEAPQQNQTEPTQDTNSSNKVDEVKIFVKYKDSNGSQRAREALNGRFFGGRKVSAEHYDRDLFRLSNYSQ